MSNILNQDVYCRPNMNRNALMFFYVTVVYVLEFSCSGIGALLNCHSANAQECPVEKAASQMSKLFSDLHI